MAPFLPRSRVLPWDEINQGLLPSQASARISLETNWVHVDKNKLQTTGGNFGRKRDSVVFLCPGGFDDTPAWSSARTYQIIIISTQLWPILAGLLLADYFSLPCMQNIFTAHLLSFGIFYAAVVLSPTDCLPYTPILSAVFSFFFCISALCICLSFTGIFLLLDSSSVLTRLILSSSSSRYHIVRSNIFPSKILAFFK